MPYFRKKPVVIEARLFDPDNDWEGACDVVEWSGAHFTVDKPGCIVETLEGDHYANPGDWIIRGVKGEFYPCKPDIFNATYDVEEE